VVDQKIEMTESQLNEIVRTAVSEALKEKNGTVLTASNLFNDIKFLKKGDIEPINSKYPDVLRLLGSSGRDEIFSNTTFLIGFEPQYYNIGGTDIHNNIRKLVLNVFGKTQNTQLTRDEYDMARKLYVELVEWFRTAYDFRLSKLSKDEEENE